MKTTQKYKEERDRGRGKAAEREHTEKRDRRNNRERKGKSSWEKGIMCFMEKSFVSKSLFFHVLYDAICGK